MSDGASRSMPIDSLASVRMDAEVPSRARLLGIDSIRFVCALWVFFGHGNAPPLENPFAPGSILNFAFRGLYGNLFSGPAAVIVFFVISGLCIHYPYVSMRARLNAPTFVIGRVLRIGVPLVAAIFVAHQVGLELAKFDKTILWSLWAEMIYYSIYPTLRKFRIAIGSWMPLIYLSFFAAVVVILSGDGSGDYPSFGITMNWILGLPCWLLGCELAERVTLVQRPSPNIRGIWVLRLLVLLGSVTCSVLRFHSDIGYPWSLTAFSILIFYWLQQEVAFREVAPANRVLEWAGRWSYSLYLMHGALVVCFFSFVVPNYAVEGWFYLTGFVLIGCYGFYVFFERPSHLAARAWMKYWVKRGNSE